MANNRIQIKRTSVSGRAANTTTLTNAGELALNMTDGIMYSTNGSVVFEIGANTTNSKVTGNLTVGEIISGKELVSTNASGDEGGEIKLTKPPNGTLDGGVTIDAYQDKIRFFEQGGSARGAYIDLSSCVGGAGTNLLAGGGGGGGFTNGQSISVNNFVLTGSFTANSSTGSAGQFLLSSNTSAYWSNVSILSVYYANGSVAFEATGVVSQVGGALGAGGDEIFYENDITITANYTIGTNKNAMTAGPVTINSGITVTVPSGSVWTIV